MDKELEDWLNSNEIRDELKAQEEAIDIGYMVLNSISILNTLYRYKAVINANDLNLKCLKQFLTILNKRIKYHGMIFKNVKDHSLANKINMVVNELGNLKLSMSKKEWNLAENKIVPILENVLHDSEKSYPEITEIHKLEHRLIEDLANGIKISDKRYYIRFRNGELTFNGMTAKVAKYDSLQGVILDLAIKRRGKKVSSDEIFVELRVRNAKETDRKRTAEGEVKSCNDAVIILNKKIRTTFNVDFNLIEYKSENVRLNSLAKFRK